MWKLLLALLLISPSAMATQWRAGTGENTILGGSQAALIGYNSYNSIVHPLDNFISNQCNEWLQYTSSSTITVMAGVCVVSNSQGSIRLIMQDTSNTVISSTNLDTGSITASTTYYVYATAATNSTTTSTYYISASETAPSGQTYYYQIGNFTTDSNSQFTSIINNNWNSYVGGKISKSVGVTYQCLTDTYLQALCGYTNGTCTIVSDSSSSPSATISQCQSTSTSGAGTQCNVSGFCQKGNYYEFSSNIAGGSTYAISMGK